MEITMNITINITNQDIMSNPDIIDGVKALSRLVAGVEKSVSPHGKTKMPQAITQSAETPGAYIEELQEEVAPQEKGVQTVEEPQVEGTSEEPQHSIEDVRKALGNLARAKGNGTAKEILKMFKVSKVTDLKPQDYDDAMLAIKAVG